MGPPITMNLFDVYPLYPVEPVQGKGSYVYDAQGTEYLDLYGGHAVISIGHAHPHYVQMISGQVARLGFYSNSVENSLQQQLAEMYRAFYADAAFTHYVDKALDLKQVVNTNKALVHVDKFGNKAVITCIIDNLLKGAVGQAVQNMNLMFGMDEKAGLNLKANAF